MIFLSFNGTILRGKYKENAARCQVKEVLNVALINALWSLIWKIIPVFTLHNTLFSPAVKFLLVFRKQLFPPILLLAELVN